MTKATSSDQSTSVVFPLVAIGASAGGIEAVEELFKNLAPDTGMAFLYVQHMEPSYENKLDKVLSNITSMKVQQVKRSVRIAPNRVYICPSQQDMVVKAGRLTLEHRPEKPNIHMPIDKLFFSLAQNGDRGIIAIILSGSFSDGAAGMKAIKSAGGITIVQDKTARFQGMPQAAIAEGAVDFILPPEGIAKELEWLGAQKTALKKVMSGREEPELRASEENFDDLFRLLKQAVGVDFSLYKKNSVKRRIARRLLLHKLRSVEEYIKFIKQHKSEANALYQDLLINVTGFFRYPEAMAYLKSTVFPRILEMKAPGESIRIWVPACSTGEEVYSIAMILSEVLGPESRRVASIRLLATDLSSTAIAKARAGVYTRDELEGVSKERLERFFLKVERGYRIAKSIRDHCIFSQHNVFQDPPFSQIDLISCSNLLIYLENELQKRIIATFHYALNPTGYLMLGRSETIGASQNLFTEVSKSLKIYAKKKTASSRDIVKINYHLSDMGRQLPADLYRVSPKEPQKEKPLETVVDEMLLKRYTPGCVVVNHDLDILQFRGSTGLFLEPSPGRASLNLLKMARKGLGFELKNAVHKAIKSGVPFKKDRLEIRYNDQSHVLSIEVLPFSIAKDGQLFLIVVNEMLSRPVKYLTGNTAKDRKIQQLEEELVDAREDMQSIIAEQEAVNEELQVANEEIVSTNEELQSINEEMETSKEEIESANEELMTINQELQERNEQLAEAQEYEKLITSTILEAVLVLDNDLKIKTANTAFYNTFHTRPEETLGKHVLELKRGQWNTKSLRELLEHRLHEQDEVLNYEINFTFPGAGKRIMIFHARKMNPQKSRQQLTLLMIEDITEKRAAADIIAGREAWFRNVANNTPAFVWVCGTDKQRTFFNTSWLSFTGRKMEEELGSGWMEDVHKDDLKSFLSAFNKSFSQHKPFRFEYRLRRHDGEYRWVLATAKPSYSPRQDFTGYIGACYEIHDQHLENEELEKKVQQRTLELTTSLEREKEVNEQKSRFVSIASHEFRTPLTSILSSISLLERYNDEQFVQNKQKHFERMKSAVASLEVIMNAFLSVEKLEQNTVEIKMERFNLEKEIAEHILPIANNILKSGQQIRFLHRGRKTVMLDKKILTGVLLNLLSNAIKFSPKGNEITVSAAVDKHQIRCSVADQGIGIPKQEQQRMFEKFFRAQNTTGVQGTGLGLNIVKRYVELLGGTVSFKSMLNEGTTFTVDIPVKPQKA